MTSLAGSATSLAMVGCWAPTCAVRAAEATTTSAMLETTRRLRAALIFDCSVRGRCSDDCPYPNHSQDDGSQSAAPGRLRHLGRARRPDLTAAGGWRASHFLSGRYAAD